LLEQLDLTGIRKIDPDGTIVAQATVEADRGVLGLISGIKS
jgi:hypothetical protein